MSKFNWDYCQKHSDEILFYALKKIVSAPNSSIDDFSNGQSGNYLILYDDVSLYIGEAIDLKNRIKQQVALIKVTGES